MTGTQRSRWMGIALAAAGWSLCAHGQTAEMNPTRPTVANSAAIQGKGTVQVETGYDAYPGAMQTVDTALYYAPLDRLRLDFIWSAFSHEVNDDNTTTNGISTLQIGGKVELKKEDYHRWAPGIAVQYEAELPTASKSDLQGYGQQAILLLNHHYGKNGDLDIMLNGSIVQEGCRDATGCRYGGQQSFAVSYHVTKSTRLYGEVFGQNNSQSNTPPGTYVFAGFYHPLSDSFGIDGGMRFGVTPGSSSYGTTVGLVFGRHVHGNDKPSH
ncbi:hypothetical protein SAMN05443244_2642 [Terriglobus roseus]|uniref:MetA-pathway of phenol degradation n=2 Tax=Terriglobus roseus TaxID=392734 RepID=A0A1H4PR38_9BACT|nr:hypothetical protein SAMN05443244_2642 [Terriglobus roseus]